MSQVPGRVDDAPGETLSNPSGRLATSETAAATPTKPSTSSRKGRKSQSPNRNAAHTAALHDDGDTHPTDRADTTEEATMAKLEPVAATPSPDTPASRVASPTLTIAKPGAFSLSKFRTTTAANIGGVVTLQQALPHHKISEAKDFVRLHPDENTHWSPELCFVNVPIQGMKRDTVHLIVEELAMQHLPAARVLRFRLALATKPFDKFFLCHVPTGNIDNSWNRSNLQACEQAKTLWVQATSLKEAGLDEYKISFAQDTDAFPPPLWPTQSLEALIEVTFNGRMITTADHPALRRLVGAKVS
jgi:hypothetical protein